MCSYCEDYSEWPECETPHKDIVKEEFDIQIGPISMETSAEVGIYREESGPVMNLFVWIDGFDPVVHKQTRINFCPMCGQKLR